MAHDVFISHSSKDKAIADAICAAMEGAGIRCWVAPRDIAPGEDWPKAISKAISQSKVMVLIFSGNANSSEQISRELSLAADYRVVVVPFKIEKVTPEPGKQYYLAHTHWLDAMNPPTERQIRALVKWVGRVLSGVGEVGADGTAVLRRQSALRRWLWIGGGVLLIGLIVWGVIALTMHISGGNAAPAFTPAPEIPSLELPTTTPTTMPAPANSSDQALSFAAPILNTIADLTPLYQDDFNGSESRWEAGNGFAMSNDVQLYDFVLQLETLANPEPGAETEILFRESWEGSYDLLIDSQGSVHFTRGDNGRSSSAADFIPGKRPSVNTPAQGNHIIVIAKGAQICIIINNTPVVFVTDPRPWVHGLLSLSVGNHPVSEMKLYYSGLKIWDITNLQIKP